MANIKIFLQKMLGFSSIMCLIWRQSLEIIYYDMGRSVQYKPFKEMPQRLAQRVS